MIAGSFWYKKKHIIFGQAEQTNLQSVHNTGNKMRRRGRFFNHTKDTNQPGWDSDVEHGETDRSCNAGLAWTSKKWNSKSKEKQTPI